jgi:hypothetical protein
VYLCTSDEETMQHAEQGHCVARATPSSSEVFPKIVSGKSIIDSLRENPPTDAQWAALKIWERERNIARALDDWQFSERRCTACGYPVADWLAVCGVCRSKEFRVPKG